VKPDLRTALKLSAIANIVLAACLTVVSVRFDVPGRLWVKLQTLFAADTAAPDDPDPDARPKPTTYAGWLDLLRAEAAAVAADRPDRLYILFGDSLTNWFPPTLLPADATWLNQGISGEVSAGLYDRLAIVENTQPDKIFINIGINDLLRGVAPDTLLDNYRRIITTLRADHPDATIVVQSILPHSADRAENIEGVYRTPNDRIRDVNDRLAAIAAAEGAEYLDLHQIFRDRAGQLPPSLTRDGLHLNNNGYTLWRSALLLFEDWHNSP